MTSARKILLEQRQLGLTGLTVASVCAGVAGWQTRVSGDRGGSTPEESSALARALFADPLFNFIDTSNNYGLGQSERRVGVAIGDAGGLPEGFVLSTKADRDSVTGDFSGDRMRRSLDESLARLGIDRFPLLFLHDPENTSWEEAIADDGPVAALVAARDEGLIEHLGISGGPADLLIRFVELDLFEALITHNRYTLVDRTADRLLDVASERGLGVMNAAPYGGGILTQYPLPLTRYAYGEAPAELLRAAGEFGAIAEKWNVPFAAIALQWSLRDPRISSTIVGMRSIADLDATRELGAVVVPDGVWEDVQKVQLDESTWQDAERIRAV
jgi:D-threo-aldose 1-dehydrogenase